MKKFQVKKKEREEENYRGSITLACLQYDTPVLLFKPPFDMPPEETGVFVMACQINNSMGQK